MHTHRTLAFWGLVAGWLIAGTFAPVVFAQPAQAAPEMAPEEPDDPADPAEPDEIVTVSPPDTPAGKQLAWVMQVLNGGAIGDISSRCTPEIIERLTAAKIEAALLEIRDTDLGGPPIALVEIEANQTDFAISGFVFGPRRKLNVSVAVDDVSGLISGLRFSRAGYLYRRAGDWDSYKGDLGKRRGILSFGAYEVVDVPGSPATAITPAKPATSRLKAIHTIDDDRVLAIAGASKVFVLGALVEAIEEGRATWAEKLPVREDLKSLPPGVMQGFQAGDEFPIEFVAGRMTTIGDQTAFDHLLARLGREKVEAWFGKHSAAPERTVPFLSTREALQLRLPTDRNLLDTYLMVDVADRRTMLAPDPNNQSNPNDGPVRTGRVAAVPIGAADLNQWTQPQLVKELGWFASAREIAVALSDIRLADQRMQAKAPATAPATATTNDESPATASPISPMLSKNLGMKINRATWPEVWHIGGGEPGILSNNYLLRRDDGRTFILCIIWNDPRDPLEEGKLLELAGVGLDLIAKYGREPADE